MNKMIENLQGKNWQIDLSAIHYIYVSSPAQVGAKLIADKKVIGWFQGGSEFGPRALGNRSILADARDVKMKAILNEKVKNRQWFRPFAPTILAEYVDDYFELQDSSPFMLLVANVLDSMKDKVPAIVHIDKTARVQTVSKQYNNVYYDLIWEYMELTGIPLVLNTSFNMVLEPIVETPLDALSCFLRTNIDYLIMNNWLISKI